MVWFSFVMAQSFILGRDSGRCFRQWVSLIGSIEHNIYQGQVRAWVRGRKNETESGCLKNLPFGDWMRTFSISVWLDAARAETGNRAFGRLTCRQQICIRDTSVVHLAVRFVLRGWKSIFSGISDLNSDSHARNIEGRRDRGPGFC